MPPEAAYDLVPREISNAFPAHSIIPPRTAAGFKGRPERPARGTKVVGTPHWPRGPRGPTRFPIGQ